MEIKSLEYFKKLPLGAYHAVSDVMSQSNHEFHGLLMEDIRSISNESLTKFCQEHDIERLISRSNDKDLARRQWFIERQISREIALLRANELKADKLIHEPYSSHDFGEIEIDENSLIPVNTLELFNVGLCHRNQVYQMSPSLYQPNSSHLLSNLIINETFKNGYDFRIRLDPLVVAPKNEFQPYFQLMEIYGKKLDWERLKTLKHDEFGQWLGDGLSTPSIYISDYVWSPSKDEVHFTCEELPKKSYLDIRGSRYFHAIFDKKTGRIIHCDGALRYYTNEEYDERIHYHVRQPEVRKVGKRVKLFQLDQPIDQSLFMRLATNFLVWNEDAIGYFN